MIKRLLIPGLVFIAGLSAAQSSVKTIAPEKNVIVSEPFRLQFVVENMDKGQRFVPPSFKGLRIVRGPEKYDGSQFINNQRVQLTNYIYTLVAERPGIYTIRGGKIKLGNEEITSDEITIFAEKAKQLTGESDDYSSRVLLPGEDALKKIRENLFIKLFVIKRSCFIGEPIVATFKLFSRLQSKSDITKNPGLYGFAVHDMLNLDDKVKETERINGKDFDVHTIRKVQLYPLQAGTYTIDEMKIENRVEFSQSVVNRKTEQEITEGVLDNDAEEAVAPGTEVYETTLATEPVTIQVKALPVKNKPADFNGAAGDFSISVSCDKNELEKNEQGFLTVTIDGKGNFTQITAPVIQWPAEIEGFEPSVKDFLDKRNVPLTGGRSFRYPFVSSVPGKWTIPGTRFSFFNIAANGYKTITTDSIIVSVSAKEFKNTESIIPGNQKKKTSIEEANKRVSRIAFILMAIAVAGALSYWLLIAGKKKKPVVEEVPVLKEITAEEFLTAISVDETIPVKEFYTSLQNAVLAFLSDKYKISGSGMNKNALATTLLQAGNEKQSVEELINQLIFFETTLFTGIEINENRIGQLNKIRSILDQLKTGYSENL